MADDVQLLRVDRRAEVAQPAGRERARHDDHVRVLEQPPLPERERRGVDGRLGARAAAVQADARPGVAAVAARAVRAAGEARADRADEAVVVQVQDGPGAGLLCGGERAPAERRVEVVRVDDPRLRALDGPRHLVRIEAASQQAGGGAGSADPGAVAREQLRVLFEVLAGEPHEVVDDALLAAGRAVAVVQEEDHVAKRSSPPAVRCPMCRKGRITPRSAPRRRSCGARCAGRGSQVGCKPRLFGGMDLTASIIVPTRERAGYLDVALASIAPQAAAAGAEVLVVDDGPASATAEVASRHGARYVAHAASRGLNAARNTGIDAARGSLLVFVDDDVEVRPGWLAALLAADALAEPCVGVLTGPIHARFEDHAFRSCGREGPPITTQELGPADRDVPHAWGANMTVRRRGLELAGRFDESRELYGDEQEWQQRLLAAGGRIRYVAGGGARPPPGRGRRAPALARRGRVRARPGEPALRRLQGLRAVGGARAARARGLRGAPAALPLLQRRRADGALAGEAASDARERRARGGRGRRLRGRRGRGRRLRGRRGRRRRRHGRRGRGRRLRGRRGRGRRLRRRARARLGDGRRWRRPRLPLRRERDRARRCGGSGRARPTRCSTPRPRRACAAWTARPAGRRRAGACSCSASSGRDGSCAPRGSSFTAPATRSRCTRPRWARPASSTTSTRCSPPIRRTASTGCSSSTTTSCCRGASSTASCTARRRRASCSRSPRTAGARTPLGA